MRTNPGVQRAPCFPPSRIASEPSDIEKFHTDRPGCHVATWIDVLTRWTWRSLGFERAQPAETGRPAYHPATLLKIYIYGYLNRVQSSRRLEREAQRNVELIWLTGRLMPDFKTIADFRKDNGEAIRTCLPRVRAAVPADWACSSEAMVAIDGSKFKAVNNRDKNFTERKLQARMQQLEESIARYLTELDRADREPSLVTEARVDAPARTSSPRCKEQTQHAAADRAAARRVAPDQQVSLTDPDARSMATSGRGTGIVGYNVQTAVDTKHHLIVAHEVTNVGHDRTQLGRMAKQAQDAIGQGDLTVLADRGYFKGEEILRCEQAGIAPLVPKPLTSNSKADGRFDKRDFVYDAKRDDVPLSGRRARHLADDDGRERPDDRTSTGRRPARTAR